MTKTILIGLLGLMCSLSYAQEIEFEKEKYGHDVFATQGNLKADFSYTYDYFKNWQKNLSGRYFDLEPAPVLRGLVEGVTTDSYVELEDPSLYVDQAAEFAAHTNFRLEGGRPKFDIGDKDPAELLENKYEETHVVEMTLSAVLDTPFENMNLNQIFVNELAENIDYDHYHFQVPGTLVSKVLEESHIARKKLDLDKNYLLSVFDLREYGCDFMKNGVRDYFSKRDEKDRLANESINLLSEVKFNDALDIEKATNYFGRRPDALISQEALYADHLIRASKMYFAFYKEGEKTRVVLLSNLAMGSKFFTGAKGLLIRQYLLDGVGGTGNVVGAVQNPLDSLKGLFDDAQADINKKNACDSGLALGLIQYSQNLFTEFSVLIQE